MRAVRLRAAARAALGTVYDPELDEPITDLGFVRSLTVDDGRITVHLRLPTSFCSPNFAYLMACDAKDALTALPGAREVTVLLDDHHDSDLINRGLATDAGYRGTFGHEAEEDLEDLRQIFRRKAHTAAMERALTALLRARSDLTEDQLGDVVLADLPDTAPTRALLRRRAALGLGTAPTDPALVGAAGRPFPPGEIPLRLRLARSVRISLDGNAHFCRGLLRTRYPDAAADQAPRACDGGNPAGPSPYRPSSRRFPDPVHLRIEDVPEFPYADRPARLQDLRERAGRLRAAVLHEGALIDRDAVWDLKRQALEEVARVPLGPGRRAAYADFLARHGQALEDHATWCALAEVHGPDWSRWPEGLKDPRSAATARARADLRDRVDLHSRLAWLTDEQLTAAQRTAREAGMPLGIVHDLAVGVHPGGADAWAQQDHFAAGMSTGAPPDAFNARGQDWGLPPWRPDRLAASGYAPFRHLLRALFRYAGALRIDHVMGLFRLWWVPQGRPPTEGTYVRYDAEAMLAILVLEASRARAVVIGEDLGTVEPGVRETLDRRGVLGTSVLWFERDWDGDGRPLPPERWRADCLATATTHDLPPTAARLTGEHVTLRHRLGLLTRPLEQERAEAAADTAEWLTLLTGLGLLHGPGDGRRAVSEEAEIQAVHRFLLRTPARMVGLWLPDAVGDRRPQNLPGTWDQYPNWRLPVADAEGRPVTLEDLAASPRLRALTDVLRAGVRAEKA
ncbi:4-alpha-glucanotransferase [Streptomyces mexicanus]|uniref:4-alpha-glucanotransferase n=1 Tax=Streptomyces mexicanus TaxID=178566 RepID=UPI00135C5C68|nr:4-alpha-glucanotransferase [Streptomyces mexicanus]